MNGDDKPHNSDEIADERVTAALHDLARSALDEPSRPLRVAGSTPLSAPPPQRSGRMAATVGALAAAGLIVALVVAVVGDQGDDVMVSEPSSPATTEVLDPQITVTVQPASGPLPTVPTSTEPVTSSQTDGSVADFDVFVSSAWDIVNVVINPQATPDEPWATFGVAVSSGRGEQTSLVFDQLMWTDPTGAIRLEGPGCGVAAGLDCSGPKPSLALGYGGPTIVAIEAFRDVSALTAGTTTVPMPAVFDLHHDRLENQPVDITIRFDVVPATATPSGDTTPVDTGQRDTEVIGGGIQLLSFPVAAFADNPEDLAAILVDSLTPVVVDDLPIDWATRAVAVFAIPTDACPPVLAGLTISNGVAAPTFVNPGYQMCAQPLLSQTYLVAIDRNVLAGVDELVLPAAPPYFEQPVSAAVDATAPTPADVPGEYQVSIQTISGSSPLPPRGSATAATLDDGTPVVIVHHHDGTISALNPVGTAESTGSKFIVRWNASTRLFLGAGAWDEYGRRLDGFRSSDLQGHATRVEGDTLTIGEVVSPPAGSPIPVTADPPDTASLQITPAPVSVDDALALPVGRTVWVDATVVSDPADSRMCVGVEATPPMEPCPPDSPVVTGVPVEPDMIELLLGPLLVTRTNDGFAFIAATGGSASQAL